jgi:hypothetical protein
MIPLMIPIAIELAKHFLPSLVSKIAGDKAGKVAEAVINTATGVTGAPSPEAALAILQADAQKAHEYRMALLANEVIMAQMAADERKDERRGDLENLQGARARDTDMRKLTGGDNHRADYMVLMAAIGVGVGMCGLGALAWLKATHPEEISEGIFAAVLTQLVNIVGIFGLCLRDAFTFEFGSSRGERTNSDAAAVVAAVSQRSV